MRIDRKRKFLGSIFLRALGMKTNEEILRTFYQVERITLRDGDLYWNLSEGLVDRKLSHEIKNPAADEVLVARAQAHHRAALQGTGQGQGRRRRTFPWPTWKAPTPSPTWSTARPAKCCSKPTSR